MICILLAIIAVIAVIISILNLIAHCIVAAIEGAFRGFAAGMKDNRK